VKTKDSKLIKICSNFISIIEFKYDTTDYFIATVLYIIDCNDSVGQFMSKGIHIDSQRKLLVYSDDRDPITVTKHSTGTGKWCWKAKKFGYQGEGLIEGDILDYVVHTILDVPENLEKYTITA